MGSHPVRRQPLVEEVGKDPDSWRLMNAALAAATAPELGELLPQLSIASPHDISTSAPSVAPSAGDTGPGCTGPASAPVPCAQCPRFSGSSGFPSSNPQEAANFRGTRSRSMRHGLVRPDEVRNEVPDTLGAAPHARRDGTSRPQDLEEIADLDATRRRCGVRLSGGAHGLRSHWGMRKSLG